MYISHRFMDQSDRLKIFIQFSKLITVTNSHVWPKPQTDSQVTVRSLFPTVLHYSAHTTESKSTRFEGCKARNSTHSLLCGDFVDKTIKCISAVFDIRLQLVRLCWISLLSLHFMSLVDSPGCFCVFEPQQLYFLAIRDSWTSSRLVFVVFVLGIWSSRKVSVFSNPLLCKVGISLLKVSFRLIAG